MSVASLEVGGSQSDQQGSLERFAELPGWLVAIVQPTTVRAALARAIPAFGALQQCEVARVRMKKDRWTALYRLTLAGPDGAQRRLQIQGTLLPPGAPEPPDAGSELAPGEEGWRRYVPELRLLLETLPEEAALPALEPLTDPAQAAAILERALRALPQYRGLAVQTCAPRVVRQKPGSRCTILYDLTYRDGSAGPTPVVAKAYKGGKGKNAHAAMRALWESPLRASGSVAIAEPLGYLPELNTALQGPVREEQMLKDLIRAAMRTGAPDLRAELSGAMRKTAAGIAALHRSGAQYGEPHTWAEALDDVQDTVGQLGAVFPQLQAAVAPLLARLEALAEAHLPDPLAPSHGSFRPAQVLLAGGDVAFIDFDSFCQAEPAFDLALFLSAVKNIGLSEPHEEESSEDDDALDPQAREALLEQLDLICEEFLAEYERHAPVSRERVALWETLELLDLVLTCWTKIKPVRLGNTLAMLERHLRAGGLPG